MIDLHLQKHTHEQVGPAKKIRMREKRRGIGFETVAGMGGYRRNTLYFLRMSSAGGGVHCQTLYFYFFSVFSRPRAGVATV